jgi:hypothetical protein
LDSKNKYYHQAMHHVKKYTDFNMYYRSHKNYEQLKDFVYLHNVLTFNGGSHADPVQYEYFLSSVKQLIRLTVDCGET